MLKQLLKLQQKKMLFEAFLDKYTGVVSIFLKWEEEESIVDEHGIAESAFDEILPRNFNHLYYDDIKSVGMMNVRALGNIKKGIHFSRKNLFAFSRNEFQNLEDLEDLIFLPHEKMEEIWEHYLRESAKLLTKETEEKFKKACEIYQKISEADAENDDEKWFHAIKEVNDEDFVIQNVECRIGRNPLNLKMWNLYFEHLKVKNSMAILDVYRRYCRLFLGDVETRQTYHKEIQKFKKMGKDVSKWILDSIKFEHDFENEENALALMHFLDAHALQKIEEKADNKIFEAFKSTMIQQKHKVSSNANLPKIKLSKSSNYIYQKFSLPPDVIDQLRKKANPWILQKLQKTAKFFFAKSKTPICQNLKIADIGYGDKSKYVHDSIFIYPKNPLKFERLFLVNKIDVTTFMGPKILSKYISKIAISKILFLNILSENITLAELKFLAPNLREFQFQDAKFMIDANNIASFHEVLQVLPKIEELGIFTNPYFNNETNQKMVEIERETKYKKLVIWDLPSFFDPISFCAFVKKNAASTAFFAIGYESDVTNEVRTNTGAVFKTFNDSFDGEVRLISNTFAF